MVEMSHVISVLSGTKHGDLIGDLELVLTPIASVKKLDVGLLAVVASDGLELSQFLGGLKDRLSFDEVSELFEFVVGEWLVIEAFFVVVENL